MYLPASDHTRSIRESKIAREAGTLRPIDVALNANTSAWTMRQVKLPRLQSAESLEAQLLEALDGLLHLCFESLASRGAER